MLLGGGDGTAAGLPEDIGAQVALGKNLTGDNCHLRRVRPGAFSDKTERYQILCEGWEQPSGHVTRVPSGRATTQWWIEKSPWIVPVTAGSHCEAAEPQPLLAGFEVLIRRCMHRSGWHQLVLVAKADGQFYLTDFLPTNAPLIERVILAATNKRPLDQAPPQGTRMASLQAMEELVHADGHLASISDIGQYRKLYDYAMSLNHARQYRKAELAMRKALEAQERAVGRNNPGLVRTLQQLTHDLRNQRRLDSAEEITRRAQTLVAKAPEPNRVAEQFNVLAYNAAARGDLEAALGYARQAVATVNPMFKDQVQATAEANYTLSRYTPDPAAAEAPLRESYRLYRQTAGENDVWTNRTRMRLASALIRLKKLPEAKALIDLAEEKAELLYGRTIWWANAKIIEADYQLAVGNDVGVLDAYRAYASVAARERFACYFGYCLAPYLDFLLAQAAKYPDRIQAFYAEAFSVVQLTDSAVIDAAIDQLAARFAARDPAVAAIARQQQDLGEQQGRLRAELASELGKQAEQRSESREQQLRQKVADLEVQAGAQELQLQDKFPRYAQLLSRKATPAAEAAKLLRPDEGLLIYGDISSKGFSLLLFQGKLEIQPVGLSSAALRQRVNDLRDGLTVRGQSLPDFDLQASHALFHDLFGQLLDKTRHPGLKRLIVVPSGGLLSLPPEILLTAPPASPGNYAGAAWLVRDYAISVVPSVRAFADLRQAGAAAKPHGGFLGVGNPDFRAYPAAAKKGGSEDVCAERRNLRAVVAKLPQLPETAEEIKTMAATIGGKGAKILLGSAATKSALQASALDKAEIVAFATHGLLPDDLLCESEPALAMAPGKESAPEDDGLLKASDITAMKMNATLVVLSACNTAGADGRLGGESLSGLVRAFFFAGSRNVLATHWPIASKPTVQLTTGAVKAARQHQDDWAGGLREVQLQMLQNPATAHPLFWGAFTLIGAG